MAEKKFQVSGNIKMNKISVLGLGPSLSLYKPHDISIGVNDIWSKIQTDYLVCLDRRERFTDERLKTIDESKPIRFYSQLDVWNNRPDYFQIELQPYFPTYICQIDIPQLPKSLCSPFVACAIAYKYHKATEIHLYGVDLVNHPVLKNESLNRIRLHFMNLQAALLKSGCRIIVYGDGLLKKL